MTSGFSFWDVETWSLVIALALLFGCMMLANILLRKVRLLRESLLPSSVLGGFLALLFNTLWKQLTGSGLFELMTLECLTYHGLGLGFIALSWRHLDGVKSRQARHDVFMTSTVTVGGYLLQAVAGLALSVSLYFLLGSFFGSGALLPMGYGQGPGQAFNWGSTYENSWGFTYGTSFGLTVAAMGFISACVGGVLYLKKLRGTEKYRAVEEYRGEHLTEADYCGDDEIPVSESMDKLTVQFALIFLTYGVSYGSMWLLYKYVLAPIGGFAMSTVNPLLWGFNFLVGVAWASLFKGVCRRLRQKGIMHREYANNFMLNRISGLMFDLMVVASIAAIDLSAFRHREFWVPLLLLCVAGAFITFYYTRYVCRRLFPTYSDEMFLVMYGMLTGTASTGIILLRQIDPLFKTPASHNVIYQNLWSIVLGAPILLTLGFIPRSLTDALICLGLLAVFAGALLLYQQRQIRKLK